MKLSFLIDTKDSDQDTPLHFAAGYNHLSTVEILISQDVKVNTKNSKLETPLLLSCTKGYFDIAKMILEKYEKIGNNENELVLLHIAAKSGAHEIVKLLLEKDAQIDYLNKTRENCLDIAIRYEQREVIKVLLNDPNWRRLIEIKPKQLKVKRSLLQFNFLEVINNEKRNKVYEQVSHTC